MDITKFLALLGAILSTIAITWNIFRDVNDKGKLKIDAMIGKMVPDHTDKDYLVNYYYKYWTSSCTCKKLGRNEKKEREGCTWTLYYTSRLAPNA